GRSGTPLGHQTTLAELLSDDTYNIAPDQPGALSRQEQEFSCSQASLIRPRGGDLSRPNGVVVQWVNS
ncbi:hypothetical protein Dimus_035373, partial [Dionaea muscipula]